MMGYWGHGYLPFGGWPMMIGGFLLFVLAVVLVVALFRRAAWHGRHHGHGGGCCGHGGPEGHGGPGDDGGSARRILDERYAKGELGDEEYARKKEALRK